MLFDLKNARMAKYAVKIRDNSHRSTSEKTQLQLTWKGGPWTPICIWTLSVLTEARFDDNNSVGSWIASAGHLDAAVLDPGLTAAVRKPMLLFVAERGLKEAWNLPPPRSPVPTTAIIDKIIGAITNRLFLGPLVNIFFINCLASSIAISNFSICWQSPEMLVSLFSCGLQLYAKNIVIHCLAKTWFYLTPYICTERIFDSQPFMYNKIFLKKLS